MYTSHIGRRLLALYNARKGKDLSARQFFDQELYPPFFAHDKYLQWVPNSPFAQKVAQKDLEGGQSAAAVQLGKLHRNVATMPPDASFVIGFPAAGLDGTTSGQVSGIGPQVGAEEIYCSWIGGALGVGVSGGLSLLLDEDDVLWTLYQGWSRYRSYLSQRPTLKGNQIDTWNGHWLTHSFGVRFDEAHPWDEFAIELADTGGTLSMPTREWVQVLFALAQHYPQRELMAYVYSLAQTNRTVGFVSLQLGRVSRVLDLHDKLFLFPTTVQSAGADILLRLYTTHYGFARACQLGAIGLAAIEPAKLRDYLTGPTGSARAPTVKTENDAVQFAFQQVWILAMLDNQTLYDAADRLAAALRQFAERETPGGKRGKNNFNQQVDQVFDKRRLIFIERLGEMLDAVNAAESYRAPFDEAVRHAMQMPVDSFPLFITLTRFRYIARQGEVAA